MNIRQVGAELFRVERRTEGRTDMMKLIVAFRNFTNAPKSSGRHKIRRTLHPSAYTRVT